MAEPRTKPDLYPSLSHMLSNISQPVVENWSGFGTHISTSCPLYMHHVPVTHPPVTPNYHWGTGFKVLPSMPGFRAWPAKASSHMPGQRLPLSLYEKRDRHRRADTAKEYVLRTSPEPIYSVGVSVGGRKMEGSAFKVIQVWIWVLPYPSSVICGKIFKLV